jgi:hypothetical protein
VSGRTVQLFWSSPIEATRWAEALAGNNELQDIALATFAADILPGLAKAKGFAGTDWVSDPIEAEVDPIDLQIRLKTEAVPSYAAAVRTRGEVFLVGDETGPMLTPAGPWAAGGNLLHVFAARSEADRHMKQAGGKRIIANPIIDFVGSTLAWAATRARAVAIEPIAGAGFLEVKIADLGRQLAAARAAT